jgi:Fic family protein
MLKISQKQQKILVILLQKEKISSSDIHQALTSQGQEISLVTVKRHLSEMVKIKLLKVSGAGRSTIYEISTIGRLFSDINAREYCGIEPDKRFGQKSFNFDLLNDFPKVIFSDKEADNLRQASEEYITRKKGQSELIRQKELERLIIELSWKSSRIEGNTYTLLDTEKLILKNQEAEGKTREEAKMILNHRDAFEFILSNTDEFKKINRVLLEDLHKYLVKDLGVSFNLRNRPVGVVGSIYKPLDNKYQISEAIDSLIAAIKKLDSPYAKALLAKIGIAYIQPFEDGNKRTSRLLANAVLLAHGLAPLSYRSIEERDYREAMLVFYELNSILPIKNIFISQYDFAARNYAV